jgi:predicted ATPase
MGGSAPPGLTPLAIAVRRRANAPAPTSKFPFSVPVIGALEELRFIAPVTFLVGENGSGKSTLLEGIAAAAGAVAMGSAEIDDDPTLDAARAFARAFAFVRGPRRAAAVAFLRAEDVFGFSQRVVRDIASLDAQLREYGEELRVAPPQRHTGLRYAMGSMAAQRGALVRRYGENPDARSHGETFLHLLGERLVPGGLYFLDEPETPLSPSRVLTLLAMLFDAVRDGSQFVIATHSPLLMAFPDADIRVVDGASLRSIAYDDVEHVRVTRDFLAAPGRYLRHLAAPAAEPP